MTNYEIFYVKMNLSCKIYISYRQTITESQHLFPC